MSASHDVKQLRILSGTHAGASLDLAPGTYSLGEARDADISISDWRFPPLCVHIGAHGSVLLRWGEHAEHLLALQDFKPVDFDGVTVCVAPHAAAWPQPPALHAARQTLDQAMARPGPGRQRPTPGWRRYLPATGLAVMALASIGWLVTARSRPIASAALSADAERRTLQRALDRIAPHRLHVDAKGTTLLVGGLVDDQAQADAAASVFGRIPRSITVQPQIGVASNIAQTLLAGTDLPDASVRYLGQGVFELSAHSEHPEQVRLAVARVAADLGPMVRRVDTRIITPAAAQTGSRPMPETRAVWNAGDGINVLEGNDGDKYIVLDAGAEQARTNQGEPP